MDDDALTIDFDGYVLRRHGQVIILSPREWELLQVLVTHADRTVSIAHLIDRVWRASSRRTVISTIHRLRQKIEDDASHPRYIHTTPGIGYRFSMPTPMPPAYTHRRDTVSIGRGV